MATDFGGKGSRRTFAARLLREVQAQAVDANEIVPDNDPLPDSLQFRGGYDWEGTYRTRSGA